MLPTSALTSGGLFIPMMYQRVNKFDKTYRSMIVAAAVDSFDICWAAALGFVQGTLDVVCDSTNINIL